MDDASFDPALDSYDSAVRQTPDLRLELNQPMHNKLQDSVSDA
jgi:hypothetical protein